jgi:isoamylase
MNSSDYTIKAGTPLPLGTLRQNGGINFALVSKHATAVTVVLQLDEETVEIDLDPRVNKTGDIWHIFVGIDTNRPVIYGYKIDGPTINPRLHSYDKTKIILDPYAKAIATPVVWGQIPCGGQFCNQPLGLIPPHSIFDWENDQTPTIAKKDLIIYEMHVRSFTRHSSSNVSAPGTFLGIIDKIPHLVELGVNAVELMPIQEFNESEYKISNPKIQQNLYQYWGYSTFNFFSPMNRYAGSITVGAAIQEFKEMVKALHKNGIKVILDVVFNHTSEGNAKGPANSFKGIDRCAYYILDQAGALADFTGCGHTFNTNTPLVQQLIIDALRYWVLEMHVDGFRFDLASIFYRDTKGRPTTKPPILEVISQDPVLADTILIAEPWDAVGLYHVGNFYPQEERWSEWNGRYRDAIRKFIKGTPSLKGKFASRISGSQDIYGSQSPLSSINFVTSHDGFSLADLVSYNQKHNLSNGENNHDGENNNDSWNCGAEGVTTDAAILGLRQRQMRNFHLALMISQGIPMLTMGDEYGHSKKGNNNTWCQDNELNWFLWDHLKENEDFFRFYRNLIAFRKAHPVLRRGHFLSDADVCWHGTNGQKTIWDKDTQFLAFTLIDAEKNEVIYCAFNAQNSSLSIEFPPPHKGSSWHWVVNTANTPPDDYYEEGQRPLVNSGTFVMLGYSAIVFLSS